MDRSPHIDLPLALQAEQLRVLYRNMPIGLVVSTVNAAILAAVEWPVVSHLSLLLWVLVIWASSGFRAWLIVNYRRGVPSSWLPTDWHRWMLVGTTLSGLGWGSSVYFFMPEIPFHYEMVQMFVLGGMAAGSISLLSVSFSLFLSLLLSLLLSFNFFFFCSRLVTLLPF